MITGADVVAAARGHLNTRWQHQGRMPGVALDCLGLVIVVARQLGCVVADFDIEGYGRHADGSMLALCERHMTRIDAFELGCVLALAVVDDPQHLAIVGDYRHGGRSVIHAHSGEGRVIETRLMFAKNFELRGIYRLPGVAP